jgi:hypothetical protein
MPRTMPVGLHPVREPAAELVGVAALTGVAFPWD